MWRLNFILCQKHVGDAVTDLVHMSAAFTGHQAVLQVGLEEHRVKGLCKLFRNGLLWLLLREDNIQAQLKQCIKASFTH